MPTSPYLIADLLGFTPHISRLVAMMNYARRTTLQTVQGLTTAELDQLLSPTGNSIGMLLEHLVAVERGYYGFTVENNHDWNAVLGERWRPGSELGALGRETIRGHNLRYYLENLRDTRTRTLGALSQKDDVWLEEAFAFWGDTGNQYFCWFHVMEDEINHRGQMRIIRNALPRFQNPGMLGIDIAAARADGTGLCFTVITPKGPADLAGLQPGDELLSLDGVDVTGLWFEEIPLAGSAGTTAQLRVQRGDQLLELQVTRAKRP